MLYSDQSQNIKCSPVTYVAHRSSNCLNYTVVLRFCEEKCSMCRTTPRRFEQLVHTSVSLIGPMGTVLSD
jgi:hypothetical protein